MEELIKRIDELEKQVKNLKTGVVWVEYQTKTTDSGLTIAEGSTTVTKRGRLLQVLPMPVPNRPGEMMLSAVLLNSDDAVEIVGPINTLKFIAN